MRRCSLHAAISRTVAGLACAAIAWAAPTGVNVRAAATSPGLPVIVSSAKRPPVVVDAPADTGVLRVSKPDGRLPAPDRFFTTFAVGDLNQGGRLLAEASGRVVSYSPLSGELSMFEVDSGKASLLLAAGVLPAGLHDLELSARGIAVLAAGGDPSRLITVRIPRTPGATAEWIETRAPIEATDITFSPTGLLVLSKKDRALYEIPVSDLPFVGTPRDAGAAPAVQKLLVDLPGTPTAIAEWRETFYVSLGRDLLVIPREMRQVSPVFPIPSPLDHVDKLRVSEDYLLAADAARGRIAVAHRPVPVAINFQGDAADTATRLLTVFEILAGYRLLPTRIITVDRAAAYDLMVAHKVLPPVREGALPADAQKRLDAVLCRLNPSRCSPLRLEPGAQLRVPSIALNQRLVTTSVSLGRQTIADVIDARVFPEDRIPVPELLRSVLNENRLLDRTLDAQLFRLNFLPWDLGPDRPLQPGTPLALRKDGTFEVVASDRRCSPESRTTRMPKRGTAFDAALRTERVDRLKPLLSIDGRIEVGVEEMEIVSATPESLRACPPSSPAATHLAMDVVVTNRVFVRAIDANNTVLYPEQPALQAAKADQPWISEKPRPEWSVTLDGPVVLGFRPWPLAVGTTQTQSQVAFRNILDVRGGRFKVPVTGWEPLMVVPVKDLALGTALKNIEHPGEPYVKISQLERSKSRATASSVEISARQDRELKLEERRAAGEKIRKLINYPSTGIDASRIVIAIAEDSGSVDLHHPDFRRNGLSIWSILTENRTAITEVQVPASMPDPPAVERTFSRTHDHGTHVAGIVAGLGMPCGLAPQASLFLLPIESQADQINAFLQLAAKVPTPIANFSQTIAIDQQVEQEILGVLDLLADQLLVVSAVDNNRESITRTLKAPIGWSDGPNVIGVAAAGADRKLLDSSDRGKRFVQLLAIGEDVLSLATNGGYARTSGASQAAPQVSSAAALMLAAGGPRLPVQIKARLIATADWDDSYEEKVWGGFLNVERAVSHQDSDVLRRTGLASKLSVAFRPLAKLQLKKSIEYPPDGRTAAHATTDTEIEWSKVLRITRQTWLPESRGERDLYRVVYISKEKDKKVTILKNVEFKPNQTFVFNRCVRLDGSASGADDCAPLAAEQIEDYVGKIPGLPLRFTREQVLQRCPGRPDCN